MAQQTAQQVLNGAASFGTQSGRGANVWASDSFNAAIEQTISRYVEMGQWTAEQGNWYRSTAKAAYNAARNAPDQVQLEAQQRQRQQQAAQADHESAWTLAGNLAGQRESWRARASLANNGIQYGPRRKTTGAEQQERSGSRSRSRSAERRR